MVRARADAGDGTTSSLESGWHGIETVVVVVVVVTVVVSIVAAVFVKIFASTTAAGDVVEGWGLTM